MQIALSSTDFPERKLYRSERSFTAAKYEETIWDRLLPGSAESYRYHLAFELAKVQGFQTGYAAVRRGGIVVCLVPYFITDYRLDSTVQGSLKRLTGWLQRKLPGLMTLRLLCVGSAVTDSAQLGLHRDFELDGEMLHTLLEELEQIAAREGCSVIAFKDVLQDDAALLAQPLQTAGFARVANMPVAHNRIDFANLDEYLASLSYATRKDLRRKLRARKDVQIEEYDGLPPCLDEIYALYLNCYEQSELQFERLTPEFFELVPALMPNNCRYVLYRAEGRLIGFNLLLHRDGVLLDKYIGLDLALSRTYNLYFLSWLHNIEMCIRDGFHTLQSGQAAYETKLRLGSSLTQTEIFFRHRNRWFNPLLRLLAKVLAYGNFDESAKV